MYTKSPPMRAPEIDFNKYEYFYFRDLYRALRIPNSNIRDLIMKPNDGDIIWFRQIEQNGLYMQPKEPAHVFDFSYYAAYLPNPNDMVMDMHEAVWVFICWTMSQPDFPDELVLPRFVRWILDPKVLVPDEGNIHLLRYEKLTVAMAAHTSGFHVFHVMEPMTSIEVNSAYLIKEISSYRRIKCSIMTFEGRCESTSSSQAIMPLHTPLIIWNAKSAARPSFKENLNKILSIHTPKVVIILEGRCYFDMFYHVYRELGTEFKWRCIECEGISGGIIVLWDEGFVQIQFEPKDYGEKSTISAIIKPNEGSLARRLFG